MAAKKKTRKPTARAQEAAARESILGEGRVFRATVLSMLERVAVALERAADSHELTGAHARAIFDILAERDGFVIEQGIEGEPLALDMSDSEFRQVARRRLQLKRIMGQERAADATGVALTERKGE